MLRQLGSGIRTEGPFGTLKKEAYALGIIQPLLWDRMSVGVDSVFAGIASRS